MPNFTAGTSFTDGVTNDVTAAKLNALIADATPTSSLALASTSGTIANFTSSTANITLGTIPTLTTGTTTSTNDVVTNGTITNLSATTSTFLGTITGSTNVINIGSGQIYKDASGNVGIGTASPVSVLDISKASDTSERAIKVQNSSSDLYIGTEGTSGNRFSGSSANNVFFGTTSAAGIEFATNNTVRAKIDSSGNVGIGTTSPTTNHRLTISATDARMDVTSTNATYASLRIVSNNAAYCIIDTGLVSDSYTTTKNLVFQPNGGNVGIGTTSPATKLDVAGSIRVSDGNGLQWGNANNYISGSGASNVVLLATNSVERLRIDSSGNVGIGTTSPAAKLHVASTSCEVIIQDSDTARASNPAALLSFWGSDARAGYIGYPGDSNMYINQINSGAILFLTNGTERLRIDSSGNVGIGTTSPAAKLHVTGTSPVIFNRATSTGASYLNTRNDNNDFYIGVDDASGGSFGKANAAIIWGASAQPIVFATNGTERLRIDSSGGVTIAGLAGTGSRAVNASAAGLLSAASDASLKEEVVGAHIAGLAEILQIHPKMYRWKDDIANRGDQASVELGFIANDVAPIIPSAAPLGNDGLYGFYDRSITAALVKAVQELSAKVTALEAA